MRKIMLSDLPNDYKVDERTQVKFCFTVKGAEYALFLVNTIINAHFESFNNFTIYCGDFDAAVVLNYFGLPWREFVRNDINVYNAKVINAMNESIASPDTLIVSVDCTVQFDFHDARGVLGRHHDYRDGIMYRCYEDMYGTSDSRQKYDVHGQILLYMNMHESDIENYLECMHKCKENIEYETDRYDKTAGITEESVLSEFYDVLRCIRMEHDMCARISHSFVDFGGYISIKRMLNNGLRYYRFCYLNDCVKEYFNEKLQPSRGLDSEQVSQS